MIRIDNDCHENKCGSDKNSRCQVFMESDCKLRGRDCDEPCERREDSEEFEESFVRPPIVPVAAGTVVIPTKPDTTTVQVLNNAALLATLTIDVRPLSKHDSGNVVITTLGGITLTSFSGTYGTTGVELAAAQSYVSLQWDGYKWVPAV